MQANSPFVIGLLLDFAATNMKLERNVKEPAAREIVT
jgi:hypothetical protein